jgi:hypothetical protein
MPSRTMAAPGTTVMAPSAAPKLRQSQFMLVPHNFYALWTSNEIIDDRAKQRDEEDDKYPDQFVVPFR